MREIGQLLHLINRWLWVLIMLSTFQYAYSQEENMEWVATVLHAPRDTFSNDTAWVEYGISESRKRWHTANDTSLAILKYLTNNEVIKANADLMALIFEEIGIHYSVTRDYPSSITPFKKSLELYSKENKKNKIAYINRNLAISFMNQDMFDSAVYYGYMAIEGLDSNQNNYDLYSGLIYKTLADALYYMGLNSRSIHYAKKAYEVFEKLERRNDVYSCLISLALSHIELEGSEEQKDFYFKILIDLLEYDSLPRNMHAPAATNIGLYYYNKREYEKSLNYLHYAEELALEFKQFFFFVHIYSALAKSYIELENVKSAKKYLDLASDTSITTHHVATNIAVLTAKVGYYKLIKDYKKANEYYDLLFLNQSKSHKKIIDNNIQVIEMELFIKQNKKDVQLLTIKNELISAKLKAKEEQRTT